MKKILTQAMALLALLTSLQAADNVLISEFMAKNNTSIVDDFQSHEDWIEIYNAGSNTVNLLGWSLTDDATKLTKWQFPATNMAPGRFIIVWASNRDRRIPGAPLHTNFKLSDTGEYLALVRPNLTIATEFAPVFPLQAANISYGLGIKTTNFSFLLPGAAAKVFVPQDDSFGTNWIAPEFNDASWSNAVTGVGFDVTPSVVLADTGLLADSVNDFSGIQGSNNWFYGYYNKTADANGIYNPNTDFNMTDADWSFTGGSWQLGAGGNPLANPPWDNISQTSWHPNGINNGAEHWAVRRWVSASSGQIHIVGAVTHPQTGSDGTRLHVFVDGTEVGLFSAANSTNEWVLNASVGAGSKVDFALDPGAAGQDGADTTTVTLKIYRNVIADSVADWTTFGLVNSRGWSYGHWHTNTAATYAYATVFTNFTRQLGNTNAGATNNWDGTQFTFPLGGTQTMQSQLYMTPWKTNSAQGSATNKVYFPVRRYTVSAQDSGLIQISGTFAVTNRANGDGINCNIYADGVQILSRNLNNTSEGYSILRRVNPGSVIDFVVDARGHGTNDQTYFTATLQRMPETLQVVAHSIYDWLGNSTQSYNGWSYGYYNKTLDGDGIYNPNTDFITSDPNWTFTGGSWVLGTNGNTTADPPWTRVSQVTMHPNGTNQVGINTAEHWPIRRWTSSLSGLVSINWRAGKQGFGGNGATCLLMQNGVVRDTIALAGTDFAGSNRVVNLTVALGDKIEFAVSPYGSAGQGDDGSDATQLSAVIWTSCGSSGILPVADTRNDWSFSGTQGYRGWYYGYYNATADTVTPGYQTNDFIAFPYVAGAVTSGNNFWTGTAWDWFAGNPPWDFIGQVDSHPNGTNSLEMHWVIRRWIAQTAGDLRVNWWLAKSSLGGSGVSGYVFHNGSLKDTVTIPGSDPVGLYRTVLIPGVQAGDVIDFAHSPVGTDGQASDSADGSLFQASIYLANGISSVVTTDISSQMLNSNATAYLRVPFTVADPTLVSQLKLRMKYDDGFVAWLNGVEIARRNASEFSLGGRVASSTNDWSTSGVQGLNGWVYGYYNKTAAAGASYNANTDFNTTDPNWSFVGSSWALGPGDPPWTSIAQSTWHPNGSNSTTENWAVRRWVPTSNGRFIARVFYAKTGTGGNGTTLRVFLNSQPLFTRTIAGTDTVGFSVNLPFTANEGDKLDFALDALGTDFTAVDGSDTTTFTCLIDQLPSTDPTWNSMAMTSGGSSGVSEEIDLTAFRNFLHVGNNLLAIQGLNATAADSDFYLLPEIIGSTIVVDTGFKGYFTSPTPGNPNGNATTNLGPVIESASRAPDYPFTNEAIFVTAKVLPTLRAVAGATLYYRVMFTNEVSVTMLDDGLHGDGAAGDGVWGATIPAGIGQPGEMIRWRMVAADTLGNSGRSPIFDDPLKSPEYHGTMYRNTNIVSKLPVLYWFVQNPSAATTVAGTRSAFFFKGQFQDNVQVNRHGQSSGGFVKKSYNFGLSSGESIEWSDGAPKIDDFSLITTWADKMYMRDVLAYETYAEAGVPGHFDFNVRVQQNGQFYSVAHFVEKGDNKFLRRLGFDEEGAFYKMYNTLSSATSGVEKKTRQYEANTDLQNLITGVTQASVPNRTLFMYDNLNVPEIIDFLATKTILSDHDCCAKNYYLYRDSNITGEWLALPWDADLTFGHVWNATNNYFDDSIITNLALFTGNNNTLFAQMFATPSMRQMYLRRVRSLMDNILGTNNAPVWQNFYRQRIDGHVAELRADVALDLAK